ncbi:MAG: DUF3084 domain-containing protein [Candidatus Riflebacteria bacterium]|nr:DUF3084 domain-containing protein [Candidatus Riflebacteria bacterium]
MTLLSSLAGPAVVLVAAVLLASFGGEKGRLLALLVMGGVLAYLGDILGGRFGKKRLSLLGLRPKHTALVFNVLTGLAITLATLLGVSFISEPFRQMLLHADELITRAAQLEVEVAERRVEVAERRKERDKLSAEAAALTSRAVALEEKTRQLDLRNEELNELLAKKEDRLIAFQIGRSLSPQPFVFPIDVSRERLQQEMVRMVDEIRRLAKLRGVTLPKGESALSHLEQIIPNIYSDIQKLREWYRRRQETGAIDQVPTECFVEAQSDKNVAIGEELHNVNFAVKANLRRFARGEQVASFTVDGTQSRSEILEALFAFDRRVMADMQERGVSSHSIEARGRTFRADLLLEFVKLADSLEKRHRRVQVELVARSDIFVYGKVDLEYRIGEHAPARPPGVDTVPSLGPVSPTAPATGQPPSTGPATPGGGPPARPGR